VAAYAGDYFKALEGMVSRTENKQPKLVLFLGSNIGNFDRQEALAFLHALRRTMNAGDALLLGADLKKPRAILEAAYDDPLGITAAFNLNLLARINRELDANFDLRRFKHHAFYQESEGRVEMYLESCDEQDVNIHQLNLRIHFALGERIHTENSHKYDLAQLAQLAAQTGFDCVQTWFDVAGQFSSNLFVATAQNESA
jgi:dimethylhistidine N-methyltransferase